MTDLGHIYPTVLPTGVALGVDLDRYQELMGLPIAAFNGLNKPDETPVFECSTIWKQSERNSLMLALAQAEEMREQELGYHIAPKYDVCSGLSYKVPMVLDNKHLVKLGLKTVSAISLDVVIDYGAPVLNDPVIVMVPTTVTDITELKVFFHGEDYMIRPSKISISGGIATISIPRSRLVKPELLDDRDDHLMYEDTANFIETLDVKRVYYDETNPGMYVWNSSCSADISISTQSMYAFIQTPRLAIVDHIPAEYSGSWSRKPFAYGRIPDSMTLYTYSGRQSSVYTELLTIRLAHTLMPNAPCTCPTVHQYWQEDTKDGEFMTPYGKSVGAVSAWTMDSRAKVGQGGKFPGAR